MHFSFGLQSNYLPAHLIHNKQAHFKASKKYAGIVLRQQKDVWKAALLSVSQSLTFNYWCDDLIKYLVFCLTQAYKDCLTATSSSVLYVQRKMSDIMAGEVCRSDSRRGMCVLLTTCSWINLTEICWCRRSFHSGSLIKLAMRTTPCCAIYYKSASARWLGLNL